MDPIEKIPFDVEWRKISAEGLNLDYAVLLDRRSGDDLLQELERTLEYFTGDLARVKVFGKWHQIPRQQVAYGDTGISYKFSGLTVPALPWPPVLLALRHKLMLLTGHRFDFVLVNRYKDGNDHIGEHRDDESELDPAAPIASLSLGQKRTFVLKHRDARKHGSEKRDVPVTLGIILAFAMLLYQLEVIVFQFVSTHIRQSVKLDLEHGSILMMNPPTNQIWYHSLPVRKSAVGIRINLTFRKYNSIKK